MASRNPQIVVDKSPGSPWYEQERKEQEKQASEYFSQNQHGTPHQGQSFWQQPQVWGPLAAVATLIGGPSVFNAFNGGSAATGASGVGGSIASSSSVLPATSGYAANAGNVGASMGGFGLGTGTGAGSAAASGAGMAGGAGSAANTLAKLFGNNVTGQITDKATNSVMGMFQPKPNVLQPQQKQQTFGMQKPQQPQQGGNVINPSSPGSPGGSSMSGLNQDLIQKIRGHFAGQSPQAGMSFGSGNTSFGGA